MFGRCYIFGIVNDKPRLALGKNSGLMNMMGDPYFSLDSYIEAREIPTSALRRALRHIANPFAQVLVMDKNGVHYADKDEIQHRIIPLLSH